MTARAVRVSVGFQGGLVLALRATAEQLEELHKRLGGSGWHVLETEDGPVRLDLGQLAYVRSESEDPRVGFGS